MLCLTRKVDQSIMIGSDIEVKVLSVCNGQVRLGIEAPKEIEITRDNAIQKTPNKEKGGSAE